jgi:hypothetical protein
MTTGDVIIFFADAFSFSYRGAISHRLPDITCKYYQFYNIFKKISNLPSIMKEPNQQMNRSFSTSADDHLCSICLRIFLDPQKTPSCSHVFCRKCATKNLQKMKQPKCPMCRADLQDWLPELQPQDEEYMKFLRATFPNELADREREDAEEAQDEKHMVVYFQELNS